MAIETLCSGCGQRLSVSEQHAGKRARCPACGQIYTVPYPQAAPDEAVQSAAASAGPGSDEPFRGDDADASAAAYGAPAPEQYWMRADDGSEYGPVDRENLTRWFREGRVGSSYQIRQGPQGAWQPSHLFQPSPTSAANPYQATAPYHSPRPYANYPKTDQSGLILGMGILGLFLCPIFAVVAWVMGSTALKDIEAGRVDPSNKGLVQAGYYLGILSVALNVLCLGGYFVIFALAILAN